MKLIIVFCAAYGRFTYFRRMILSAKPQYSIVLLPPQEGIDYVANLKNQLNDKIGWYNSRNAKAHVTVCEFTADLDELDRVINDLKEIASYEVPHHLVFDGVDSYANGAVFLKPDAETKAPLTALMVRVQKNLGVTNQYKSKSPHMSIGRKLSEENVALALDMFAGAKLEFNCANLVLRKFNHKIKQYVVFSEDFPFLGLTRIEETQQSLF
ncbi:2'-5' RNA ligase family protein [Pedobacter helvus]|uniref:2'-5' RNA ligase family protein n=1 Tax=Pedobacter helvus TaxID=2563444 RepID=A0ABW9JL01_9SPHI|nr:2'-5' RNA ligase family protein [Pedobacter ureilyticus]